MSASPLIFNEILTWAEDNVIKASLIPFIIQLVLASVVTRLKVMFSQVSNEKRSLALITILRLRSEKSSTEVRIAIKATFESINMFYPGDINVLILEYMEEKNIRYSDPEATAFLTTPPIPNINNECIETYNVTYRRGRRKRVAGTFTIVLFLLMLFAYMNNITDYLEGNGKLIAQLSACIFYLSALLFCLLGIFSVDKYSKARMFYKKLSPWLENKWKT
ncbi:hypothetical protein ACU62C_02605 [Klebsiella aerogenes]